MGNHHLVASFSVIKLIQLLPPAWNRDQDKVAGHDLTRSRAPLPSPDDAQQSSLLLGLHADEFDTELFVSRPTPHGQIDRQCALRLVEVNLDLKIPQVRCGVGASNPAPLAGDVDDRSALSDHAVAEIHRKRDQYPG